MHVGAKALEGRIVLVTGAAGTLGAAISTAIEIAAGTVVRTDLPDRLGMDFALDVTNEGGWVTALAEIGARHGRLDGLVNNAGIAILGDVECTSLADWRRVQAVNVDGVFLGCKHAMPLLAKVRRGLDRQSLVRIGPRRRRQSRGLQRVERGSAAALEIGGALGSAQAAADQMQLGASRVRRGRDD